MSYSPTLLMNISPIETAVDTENRTALVIICYLLFKHRSTLGASDAHSTVYMLFGEADLAA